MGRLVGLLLADAVSWGQGGADSDLVPLSICHFGAGKKPLVSGPHLSRIYVDPVSKIEVSRAEGAGKCGAQELRPRDPGRLCFHCCRGSRDKSQPPASLSSPAKRVVAVWGGWEDGVTPCVSQARDNCYHCLESSCNFCCCVLCPFGDQLGKCVTSQL